MHDWGRAQDLGRGGGGGYYSQHGPQLQDWGGGLQPYTRSLLSSI
jgi:hypothetical protein